MNNNSILPIFNPIQNRNPGIMRGLVPPTTMANFAPGVPLPASAGRLGNLIGDGIHTLSSIAGPGLTAQAQHFAEQAAAKYGPQMAAAQAAANKFAPQLQAAATIFAPQLQAANASLAPHLETAANVLAPHLQSANTVAANVAVLRGGDHSGGSDETAMGGSYISMSTMQILLIAVSIMLLILIIYLVSIGTTLDVNGLSIPCKNNKYHV